MTFEEHTADDVKEEIDSEIVNFHKKIVLSKNYLHQKIKDHLESNVESQQILVPNGLQMNTKFNVPKPLKCSLFTTSPSHDSYMAHYSAGPQSGVFLWSKNKNDRKIHKLKKKLDFRISHIVYVPSSCVYFAACDDLTLRTFGQKFQEHYKVPLKYSILSMIHDDIRDYVVTGRVGFIQQWMLQYIYVPATLLRQTTLLDQVTGSIPWISFIHHDKDNDYLLALTDTAIFIVDAESLEQYSFIENRHAFPLTTCFAYAARNYLITAATNGDIRAWNTSMNSFPYLGTFKGHLKTIVDITTHPDEPLLITASQDSTIRFWRIETFQETYRFDAFDTILHLRIINSRKLYYGSPKSLCFFDYNYFHSLFSLIGTTIISLERVYANDKPARILLVGEDGGVRIVSPTHGHVLTMIFPMIAHKPIHYIHDCIEEKVYLLLEDGHVMVMSSKTNPCRTVEFWKSVRMDEKVTCIGLSIVLVDNEEKSFLFGAHVDGRISLLRGLGYKMASASSRGAVRFEENVARNSLIQFLTYNKDNVVTLWRINITPNSKTIYLTPLDDIELGLKPSHMAIRGQHFGFSNGKDFITIFFTTPMKLGHFFVKSHNHSKDEKHQENIQQVRSCWNIPIFATSSSDGRVKIWSLTCELLRELAFDKTLSGLCFANDNCDLLVGFQSNIHFVPVMEFLPNSYLKMLLQCEYEDDETEYCISFDPLLRFWYDKEWVPTIPLLKTNQFILEQQKIREVKEAIDEQEDEGDDDIFETKSHPYLLEGEKVDFYRAALLMTHLATSTWDNETRVNIKSQLHSNLAPHGNKRRSTTPSIDYGPLSGLSLFKELSQEIVHIVTNKNLFGEMCSIELLRQKLLTMDDKQNEVAKTTNSKKKYWPFAPDGYIPNSIIRNLILLPLPKSPVKPYRPRKLSTLATNQPVFSNIEEDDSIVREWYSDEEEEKEVVVEETNGNYRDDSLSSPSPVQSRRKQKQQGKNKKKDENLFLFVDSKIKKDKIRAESATRQRSSAQLNKTVKQLAPKSNIPDGVPVMFHKYYGESWFPKHDQFDIDRLISELLEKIDPSDPMLMKEILGLILETHKNFKISDKNLEQLQQKLIGLLYHPTGQVRHYAVQMLMDLGLNRKDIILHLIPKLADSNSVVRDEVKVALDKMAGIHNADTLLSTLKEMGEFRTTKLRDDREVINENKEALMSHQGIRKKGQRNNLQVIHKSRRRNTQLRQEGENIVGDWSSSITHKDEDGTTLSSDHLDKELHYDFSNLQMERKNLGDSFARVSNINFLSSNQPSGKSRLSLRKQKLINGLTAQSESQFQDKLKSMTVDGQGMLDLRKMFPHVYKRFSLLEDDFDLSNEMKPIMTHLIDGNSISQITVHTEDYDDGLVSKKTTALTLNTSNRILEKREGVEQEQEQEQEQEEMEKSIKEREKRNIKRAVKLVLATAVCALRANRTNRGGLKHYNIIENETINDIITIMKYFQNTDKYGFRSAELDAISKTTTELQKEFHNLDRVQEKKTKAKVSKIDVVPSFYKHNNMVPGIHGERILNHLKVSDRTQCCKGESHTQRVMQSIPARNGCATLTQRKGCTKYGPMEFHWTTMTSGYDMNVIQSSKDSKITVKDGSYLPSINAIPSAFMSNIAGKEREKRSPPNTTPPNTALRLFY